MRYYRIRRNNGWAVVAETTSGVFDVTAARPQVTTVRDLFRVSAVADRPVDDLVRTIIDDAPLIETPIDETSAALPVVPSEIWAAGVTYEISEEARTEESSLPDVYIDVYSADRPEIFFKATPSRTVGPGEAVGIREDSNWDVPEPELGVVLFRGDIVGYTIGNDMSSRDIEGQNPLYLPQAKVYDRCCSIGPSIATPETIADPHDLEMTLEIERSGDVVVSEATSTAEMARTCEELTSYLTRHNAIPELAVLLTGTSLVPPDDFTLEPEDVISIELEGLGTLENSVTEV